MPRAKAAPTAEEAMMAGEQKESAAKKPAARKTAAKKAEAAKEECARKAPVKKAAGTECAVTMTIQFQGRSIAAEDVLDEVKKAYAKANPDAQIQSVDIYVKPEENVAYYAVNGEGSEDFKILL